MQTIPWVQDVRPKASQKTSNLPPFRLQRFWIASTLLTGMLSLTFCTILDDHGSVHGILPAVVRLCELEFILLSSRLTHMQVCPYLSAVFGEFLQDSSWSRTRTRGCENKRVRFLSLESYIHH